MPQDSTETIQQAIEQTVSRKRVREEILNLQDEDEFFDYFERAFAFNELDKIHTRNQEYFNQDQLEKRIIESFSKINQEEIDQEVLRIRRQEQLELRWLEQPLKKKTKISNYEREAAKLSLKSRFAKENKSRLINDLTKKIMIWFLNFFVYFLIHINQ